MSRPVRWVRVFSPHAVAAFSAFHFKSEHPAGTLRHGRYFGRFYRAPYRGSVLLLCLTAILVGCRHRTVAPPLPPARSGGVVAPPVAKIVPVAPVVPEVSALALYRPTPKIFGEPPLDKPAHQPEGAPERKMVALTFDAGSEDDGAKVILQHLKEHHVRVTFFLTGRFCERFPDTCKAIADAGMELGNHSYSHPPFTKRTDKEILAQLDRADEAIKRRCGRSTKPLFRFPYGDCNPRVRQVVARAGYQPIGWTLDSLDSYGRQKSADYVAKRIIAKIKPGYIALFHVEYPESGAALPRILEYLEKERIEVVPVSELLLANTPKAK